MSVLYEKLPRELRDQIYELVLTEPMGLSCCTGHDGISTVCAMSNDGLQQAALSSRIRDLCHSLFPSTVVESRVKSFNQIQYVSRGFHKETVGLEFKYNDIVFEDGGGRTAAQRCQIFVNKILSRDYAQYLKLCIVGSTPSLRRTTDGHYLTLLDFCARHPKATIRLHDRNWSLQYPNFILLGLGYADTLRGDRYMLRYLMRNLDPFLEFDLSPLRSQLPRNYRVFPHELQSNQAMLSEAIRQSSILQSTDTDRWMALAEQWFREGV